MKERYIIEKNEIDLIIAMSEDTDFDGRRITTHNYFGGKRNFALSILEGILIELRNKDINDKKIIDLNRMLYSLVFDENNEYYKNVLHHFSPNEKIYNYGLNTLKDNTTLLTNIDLAHLKSVSDITISSYMMLGEYQKIDYDSLRLIISTLYVLLILKLDYKYKLVDIVVDINNDLQQILVYIEDDNYEPDKIIVDFDLINQIEGFYLSYKSEYPGLEENSFLELASANLTEKLLLSDERFVGSYSMLTKQYCSIIEIEINKIIQLKNLPNKPNKHLMWNDMKKYIEQNNIELCFDICGKKLYKILDELHPLRNKAAHGETMSKEEYEILELYKIDIFQYISQTKLMMQNIIIHPTIEEISKMLNINFKYKDFT